MRTTEKVEKNKNTKIDNFFMDSESESLINSSSSNEISYDRNISDSEGDSLLNYDESDNENDNLDDNIEIISHPNAEPINIYVSGGYKNTILSGGSVTTLGCWVRLKSSFDNELDDIHW